MELEAQLMNIKITLLLLGVVACKGKGSDDRDFATGRLGVLEENSGDAAPNVETQGDKISVEDLEKVITEMPPEEVKISVPTVVPPAPPPPLPPLPPATPPKPELSAELKAKLAKCAPQWESIVYDKNTLIDIRELNFDATQLNGARIQLGGDKPEVVFVNLSSNQAISQVALSLENPKALYCVDIEAAKAVECIDLSYICGSKLGMTNIDATYVRNVNIQQFCPEIKTAAAFNP